MPPKKKQKIQEAGASAPAATQAQAKPKNKSRCRRCGAEDSNLGKLKWVAIVPCKQCSIRPTDTKLRPCKHEFCSQCAAGIQQCPTCDKNVEWSDQSERPYPSLRVSSSHPWMFLYPKSDLTCHFTDKLLTRTLLTSLSRRCAKSAGRSRQYTASGVRTDPNADALMCTRLLQVRGSALILGIHDTA